MRKKKMWKTKKYRPKICTEAGLDEKGKHNFEPRHEYKYAPGHMERIVEMTGDPRRWMEKIYVHDICVYCGEIRKREE
jgi:hypothetical protein